jgi:hypothetical protein
MILYKHIPYSYSFSFFYKKDNCFQLKVGPFLKTHRNKTRERDGSGTLCSKSQKVTMRQDQKTTVKFEHALIIIYFLVIIN